ncbi:M15 family metallopeptidase [Siansivirga zeaxanthinifaciens]|uniref:Peptidase M15B and M15C DD-carboxypeptidase VanY/endolysin n=1 Tax=Siansivirga zeaxanthinifaciens CC-SAMT-1 TaxID=1454006 RepID=A0A0C5WHW9_9FLAO|nr:M15 family metallopeptidase [Siansivirga zeaxanthinifaciens]AJR02275.1 peptidase M15B and M15C DD-carboxypeptidase VanY/endolysin [Siansivirga zeaxanthinifaciens CC-SAMT-1]
MSQLRILIYFFLIVIVSSCKKKDNAIVENKTKVNNLSTTPEVPLVKCIERFKLLGKFNYRKDTAFVKVPSNYSFKNVYIQKVVLDSFVNMATAAKKDGISFKIVSGTRNFTEQKRIWERKWRQNNMPDSIKNALLILKYSSMPSTSRHHWGTDIDINNLNNSYFAMGKGKKEYDWLSKNAHKFGFFQPYTSKENGRTGYNEEKWHWSFKPLSDQYLKVYNDLVTYEDINGFLGFEIAPIIDVIPVYVNGIEY